MNIANEDALDALDRLHKWNGDLEAYFIVHQALKQQIPEWLKPKSLQEFSNGDWTYNPKWLQQIRETAIGFDEEFGNVSLESIETIIFALSTDYETGNMNEL